MHGIDHHAINVISCSIFVCGFLPFSAKMVLSRLIRRMAQQGEYRA